jgi:hypothetical protein
MTDLQSFERTSRQKNAESVGQCCARISAAVGWVSLITVISAALGLSTIISISLRFGRGSLASEE